MIDIDALFGGESEEDRVKQERMRRYRADMEKAKGYGQPSGIPGVASIAAGMHGQQGQALQGMANQVSGAYQREHDSRLAQMREQRRMEHEKEMAMMATKLMQQEQEGAIIRSLLYR